jgi:hypothetical protein
MVARGSCVWTALRSDCVGRWARRLVSSTTINERHWLYAVERMADSSGT